MRQTASNAVVAGLRMGRSKQPVDERGDAVEPLEQSASHDTVGWPFSLDALGIAPAVSRNLLAQRGQRRSGRGAEPAERSELEAVGIVDHPHHAARWLGS